MDIRRCVMDLLLQNMIEIKLGEKINFNSNIQQLWIVQQTKIVDDKGRLETVFPSCCDLH